MDEQIDCECILSVIIDAIICSFLLFVLFFIKECMVN